MGVGQVTRGNTANTRTFIFIFIAYLFSLIFITAAVFAVFVFPFLQTRRGVTKEAVHLSCATELVSGNLASGVVMGQGGWKAEGTQVSPGPLTDEYFPFLIPPVAREWKCLEQGRCC